MNNTITTKISNIEREWRLANAAIQSAELNGWARQAALAGVEHGAMIRVGQAAEPLADLLGLDPEDPAYDWNGVSLTGCEAIGRSAWDAYISDRLCAVIASI